jgi:hypothetical protein
MEYEIWNTDKWNMKYGIPINGIPINGINNKKTLLFINKTRRHKY